MTKREILDALASVNAIWATDHPMTVMSEEASTLRSLERYLRADLEAETQRLDALRRAIDSGTGLGLPVTVPAVAHVRTQAVRRGPPPVTLSLPAGAALTIRLPSPADEPAP